MQTRRVRFAALAAAGLLLLSGTLVLATHESQGLGSALLARGSWDRSERTAFLAALAAQGKADQADVAVISATLDADGYTNWHGHPGPSVVIVTQGTLTVLEPTPSGCREREFGPGSSFFHSSGNHDFRNNGSEQVVFYITYFVTAWPPLIHHDDAGTCG